MGNGLHCSEKEKIRSGRNEEIISSAGCLHRIGKNEPTWSSVFTFGLNTHIAVKTTIINVLPDQRAMVCHHVTFALER